MNQSEGKSKVYIEIVKQLRVMIETDGLKAGDKIPSERELSERLDAGRSSVREALRALELLGLIETRRGEGTFIRDFRENQLVQLLSTFILQDKRAKRDVVETKYLIEMDCLRQAAAKSGDDKLAQLKQWTSASEFSDDDFFLKIADMADNHLLFRIWKILKDYYNSLGINPPAVNKAYYEKLTDDLLAGDIDRTLLSYWQLRDLSKE
ncbi:FadR/GntR family transcriptional regulator [Mesobacillus harenae]|uniref:FadR/GntR family transcriptional regulator n=1 Tax=Mesobacillus harenae TaxID=2213203 RepID=UPI0030CFDFE7